MLILTMMVTAVAMVILMLMMVITMLMESVHEWVVGAIYESSVIMMDHRGSASCNPRHHPRRLGNIKFSSCKVIQEE